jgi:hypothetical protein
MGPKENVEEGYFKTMNTIGTDPKMYTVSLQKRF